MFKKMKKYLLLIPCMIFGMFLFSGSDVLANEAKLLNSSNIYVGEQTKANKYYFSNDFLWEFKVDGYDVWGDGDTFLKWRVVRPDGMATDWQGGLKDTRYVDNNGIFTIRKYNELSYTQSVGLSGRESPAPVSTYYVDIQYYSHFLWSSHQKEKDETVKIIVGANTEGAAYIPAVTVDYEQASRNFTIGASLVNGDGRGTGIITSLKYFFSDTKMDDVKKSSFIHALNINYGKTVSASLENVEASAKYLYVFAESGNGYNTILEYNIDTKTTEDTDQDETPTGGSSDKENPKGLFDYEFGEIILIVLIIVLVVSCALIITQKIVDYKKRLY